MSSTTIKAKNDLALPRTNAANRLADTRYSLAGEVMATLTLLLGALAIILTTLQAVEFYRRPFFGTFLSAGGVVSQVRSTARPEWEGLTAGLRAGDQITGVDYAAVMPYVSYDFVNGQDVAQTIYNSLEGRQTGEVVTVRFIRTDPNRTFYNACDDYTGITTNCRITYRLRQFGALDLGAQFGIGIVSALLIYAIGVFAWLRRRRDVGAQMLIGLCGAMAMVIASRFDQSTTFSLGVFWILGAITALSINVAIALLFPYPLIIVQRFPILRILLYIVPAAVIIVTLLVSGTDSTLGTDFAQSFIVVGGIISVILLLAAQMIRYRRAATPKWREQSGVLVISMVVALVPFVVWALALLAQRYLLIPNLAFSATYVTPITMLYPLGFAYALFSNRSTNSDFVVGEGLVYSILGVLLIVGFILLTGGIYWLTAGSMQASNPFVIVTTIILISVLFTPLRRWIERQIDTSFMRQRRSYDRRVEQFSIQMTQANEVADVIRAIDEEVREALNIEYLFIFMRNLSSGDYQAQPDPQTGTPATDVRFRENSGLLNSLRGEQSVLRLDRGEASTAQFAGERARLGLLNTPIIIRLKSTRRLNGFVALGPRRARQRYNPDDLRYLQSICDLAASALERAQVVLEAQRNERDLKVLSQISNVLNTQVDADNLLEFTYAQITKVIPSANFYIVLADPERDELYFAFYQEDGERNPQREGFRWKVGRDLYSEVYRTQQPIRTENYLQEARSRESRLRVEHPHIRAWMAVPLNVDEGDNLGCLALASANPEIVYSEDQVRIFWDIASLAATALKKAQLYAEASEQARQMKALNDISQRLATEFEKIELLPQIITQAAMDILNCEAGSLLLRDENTDQLEFEVALGGAGESLIGERIRIGDGIVGKVAKDGQNIIVNDAQASEDWLGEIGSDRVAEQQKFMTRNLIAVPLSSRRGVIGVLELLNKRDRRDFTDADARLLNTFASQAAVAIENARLFRSTDEQLSARVKQMDTIQRIDQELNRTLDLNRVVDLTVDNAIRESRAEAGALVLVKAENQGFEVVSSQGYPADVVTVGKEFASDSPSLAQVVNSGMAMVRLMRDSITAPGDFPAMPESEAQVIFPMIRTGTVNGMLILEGSADRFGSESREYLQGLADRANTALTNAQLFQQVQAANRAKNLFVSTIAHELGNPLTSIKGYSETLGGGMAGALSETQTTMLNTIKRNASRMEQLVNDLRDMDALESGRLGLKREAVNFNDVILDAIRSQQVSFDEKDQELIINVSENLPEVYGDKNRLFQILLNLLTNANKYTPEFGKVTITAEVSENVWQPEGPSRVVYCSVQDTGIGMSEEDLSRLFRQYWRSDNPKAREQKGTGLGMAITRALVESHQGRMIVTSELEKGTTFAFTVPLVEAMILAQVQAQTSGQIPQLQQQTSSKLPVQKA